MVPRAPCVAVTPWEARGSKTKVSKTGLSHLDELVRLGPQLHNGFMGLALSDHGHDRSPGMIADGGHRHGKSIWDFRQPDVGLTCKTWA
jgi:hypothetical protein